MMTSVQPFNFHAAADSAAASPSAGARLKCSPFWGRRAEQGGQLFGCSRAAMLSPINLGGAAGLNSSSDSDATPVLDFGWSDAVDEDAADEKKPEPATERKVAASAHRRAPRHRVQTRLRKRELAARREQAARYLAEHRRTTRQQARHQQDSDVDAPARDAAASKRQKRRALLGLGTPERKNARITRRMLARHGRMTRTVASRLAIELFE